MVLVPGGEFRIGSDQHYPEEAPAHRVRVDGFWVDRTPITNRQFRQFVDDTGYITFAEVAPYPRDCAGALLLMLKAASLVSTPLDHPVAASRSAGLMAALRVAARLMVAPITVPTIQERPPPRAWRLRRSGGGGGLHRLCTTGLLLPAAD